MMVFNSFIFDEIITTNLVAASGRGVVEDCRERSIRSRCDQHQQHADQARAPHQITISINIYTYLLISTNIYTYLHISRQHVLSVRKYETSTSSTRTRRGLPIPITSHIFTIIYSTAHIFRYLLYLLISIDI